jgi:ATP-dependent Clp protease adaptor protein ClpS
MGVAGATGGSSRKDMTGTMTMTMTHTTSWSEARDTLTFPVPAQQAARMMAGKTPGNGAGRDDEGKTGLVTKTRPKTKKPSLYKVLLLNDDYTPMEFVVHVLERYFGKGREEATRIMLHVHHKGVGVCGVFTYEIAETKVTQVMDFSRQHDHPLQCTMEKE